MTDVGRVVTKAWGRVLVVDDEPNARSALADLLAEEGYAIEMAANGFKALDRLADFAPDLVLTDLNMPGMDGLQLTQRIHQRNADLPVVVMSAFCDLQTTNAINRAGARHFLPKPLNLRELTAVLAEEMSHRRQ